MFLILFGVSVVLEADFKHLQPTLDRVGPSSHHFLTTKRQDGKSANLSQHEAQERQHEPQRVTKVHHLGSMLAPFLDHFPISGAILFFVVFWEASDAQNTVKQI